MMSMEDQLKLVLEKLDRVLSVLEAKQVAPRRRAVTEKTQKQKAPSLAAEEIAALQERFEHLFGAWDAGEELQVERELDAMNAPELRRFADANNLNVTSKTPKHKVMQLIAGRFRERRQLMRSHFQR